MVEHVAGFAGRDRFGRAERGPAREDGHPREVRLFFGCQELIAPGNGVAERLLAVREIARAAGEDAEAVGEPGEQGGDGEDLHSGRGQFDRERQSVQTLANLGDRGGVRFRQGEPRANPLGGLDEQPHRVALGNAVERLRCRRGELQRLDRELPFAPDMERQPAGDDQGQTRAGAQQAGEVGRRGNDLLHVVEHDQRGYAAKSGGKPLGGVPGQPGDVADIHRPGDRGQDLIRDR